MRAFLYGLAAALLAAAVPGARAETKPPIAITLVAPLTGAVAPGGYGEEIRLAATLWQQQVNQAGGILGRPVALTVEDDAGDPGQARAVAIRVAARRPVAVIGHALSTTTLPAAEIYKESGILLLAFANADALTKEPSPYLFRIIPRNGDYAPCLAAEIARKAAATPGPIYVIHDGTQYGRGMAEDTLRFLPQDVARRVVPALQVAPQDKDFTTLITEMRRDGAPIVFISTGVAEAGLIVRQASQAGFHPAYFGHSILTSEALPGLAGDDVPAIAIEALAGGDLEKSRNDPAVEDLARAYAAADKTLTPMSLVIASALDMVRQAITRTGSTAPLVLSKALHENRFATPLGPIAFSPSGDIARPAIVTYRWRKAGPGYALKEVSTCR